VREVPPALVDPNPHQPRTNFDSAALEALAASIRVHGILQPLVVTAAGDRYELIAGERRLRAAKIAGLDVVPVIIRSFDEQQKLELALIENLQRAELNPIEVATAYRKLIDQFNVTLGDISKRVGKDTSTISNTIRLLGLPVEVKRAVIHGEITEGHGRVILALTDPDEAEQTRLRLEAMGLVLKHKWTVRQLETYVRAKQNRGDSKLSSVENAAPTNQLTMDLGEYLGTKVTQLRTAKGGKLVIENYSEEELERIYKAIKAERE
jgi:ParB family chromosome partitioning protein